MTAPAGRIIVQDDFESYDLGESLNEKGVFDGIDGIDNWYKPPFNGMLASIEDGTGEGFSGQVLRLRRASSTNETFAIYGGKANLGPHPDPDNDANGLTRSTLAVGCNFLFQKQSAGASMQFGFVLRAQDVTPNSEDLQAGDVVCQYRDNSTDMRILGPVAGDPVQGPTDVNLSEGTIYWAEALITDAGAVEFRIRASKGGSILGEMSATVDTLVNPGWWGVYALHPNNINDYTMVDNFELQEVHAVTRVSSSYGEELNSLQVGVKQQDISLTETYLRSEEKDVGSALTFVTLIEPSTGLKDFTVAGSSPEDFGLLTQYRYETKLARLNETFPPQIVAQADDVMTGQSVLTARQVVDFVFTRWAAEYSWFTFETVPELYIYDDSDSPGTFNKTLTTEVVALKQDSDSPTSMRQMIDSLLSSFPGHALILNADDNFEVRVPFWSAAYSDTTVALTTTDLRVEPRGELDIDTVVNRVTVRGSKFSFVEDTALTQDGMFFESFVGRTNDRGNQLVPTSIDDPDVNPDSDYDIRGNGNLLPFSDNVIVGGDRLIVTLQLDLYASGHGSSDNFVVSYDPDSPDEGTGDFVFNPDSIAWRTVRFSRAWTSVGHDVAPLIGKLQTVDFLIRLDPNGNGVVVQLAATSDVGYTHAGFTFYYAYALNVSVTGSNYTQTENITGTFGQTEDTGELVGLQASFDSFGVREGTLQTQFFSLEAETAVDVAKSIVNWRKDPRRRYSSVELSFKDGWAIKPNDVGRLASLPDGTVIQIEGWSYSDQVSYQGQSAMTAAFSAIALEELTTRVPITAPGVIDMVFEAPTIPFSGAANVPTLELSIVGQVPVRGPAASVPTKSFAIVHDVPLTTPGAAAGRLVIDVAGEVPVLDLGIIPPELTIDVAGQVPTILAT